MAQRQRQYYTVRFEQFVSGQWQEVDELAIPPDALAEIQDELAGNGSYSHPHFETSSGSVWRWELIPEAPIEEVKYLVADNNATERADTFAEAAEVIADWFREYPKWATGEASQAALDSVATAIDSVEPPSHGGLEALQSYANALCDAIADACGMDDFHGHGRYHVRAADRIGLQLTVSMAK